MMDDADNNKDDDNITIERNNDEWRNIRDDVLLVIH